MSGCKTFFMVFYALLAFIGLLAWGKAEDLGMTVFGLLLMLFGVLNAYRTIGRHFDDAKAH